MIYLDNAAATPPSKEVVELFTDISYNLYPNQESIHSAGYNVRKRLDKFSHNLASLICSNNKGSVCWVNSGTEGLNSVLSHSNFNKGNIITTNAEHAALTEAIKCLDNVSIRNVNLKSDGAIDLEHLETLLDDNTVAVAIHHVQSETGVIQDLISVRSLMNKYSTKAAFIVDSVQSIAKVYLPWEEAKIDFCFVAGHKIGSPYGAAIVYRDKNKIYSSHFKNLRSTRHLLSRPEPVSVAMLNLALETGMAEFEDNRRKALNLNKQLREGLNSIVLPKGAISATVDIDKASPYIVHFTVPGFQSAVLLRFLSAAGVMVSSGSACEAETKNPSRALIAMGFDRAKAFSAIRVSFWKQTTKEDISALLEALQISINDY